MDETWILHGASIGDVIAWLHALAQRARDEQAAHPLRSQTAICHIGQLDLLKLPLPVRSEAQMAAGIYTRMPSAGEPFGRLLVLLLVEQVEAGALRVEIVTDPAFALRGDEIRWHFQQTFARATRGAGGRRTGLLIAINRPAAQRGVRTGAPVLPCNIWLEEQLAALGPERRGRRRLFRPWLEQYHKLRGVEPADPLRSFRAAVAGCEKRLAQRVPPDERCAE
jgi:hypothetical protein